VTALVNAVTTTLSLCTTSSGRELPFAHSKRLSSSLNGGAPTARADPGFGLVRWVRERPGGESAERDPGGPGRSLKGLLSKRASCRTFPRWRFHVVWVHPHPSLSPKAEW
jgi:hypothetical protein